MKKNAFTLAEILLTLAIIGVVGALTIPAVVTKVQQDQYVVGLKKAYNTLKSVEREAREENGTMENWDWFGGDPTASFEKYFKPHFDILKNCGATMEAGCFPAERKLLDGSPWSGDFDTTSHYRIVTSDGMAWLYTQYLFYVDVNGLKRPNRVGRDIFVFNIYHSDLGIRSEGSYNDAGLPIETSIVNEKCSKVRSGWHCTAKVLAEGAMNY